MGHRSRGSTLIELMVSMFVFGLLLTTVFLVFSIGSRGFRTVETRQTAQNQLASIRASVQNDLQTTHFYGTYVDSSTQLNIDGVNQPRHVLSAVALSDWNDSTSFDPYGVPQWDQWVVYRVTYEEKGQLVRHVVRPSSGEGRALLRPAAGFLNFARTVALDSATWTANVGRPQVLARGIRSFSVVLDADRRAIDLEVTIEQLTDPKNPKPDVVTAKFFVQPHNTVPVD